jgi:hypothetical protein
LDVLPGEMTAASYRWKSGWRKFFDLGLIVSKEAFVIGFVNSIGNFPFSISIVSEFFTV